MKRTLTLGKYRGLQQISDPKGIFSILALDHRGSLFRSLAPENPQAIAYQRVVDFKREVGLALAKHSSALLIDPQYGIPALLGGEPLSVLNGLLVTLEQSGYQGNPNHRRNIPVEGWDVEKIKRLGAAAVKLLLLYNPESPSAAEQESLLQATATACQRYDIALLLECVVYPLEPGPMPGSAEFAARKPELVIEAARRLCPMGVDIFKVEFPGDLAYEGDQTKLTRYCQMLTEAAGIPWVLLSAAVDFDTFKQQVQIACDGGASGFLAGRAIWKEATKLDGETRCNFLNGEAAHRLQVLSNLASSAACSWNNYYRIDLERGWYTRY